VVVGRSVKNGRVHVRIGATVFALRPDNLLPLRSGQTQAAPVAVTNIPATTALAPGEAVVLHGLHSRPALNGAHGQVVGTAQDSGRILVRVADETLAIKACNLRRAAQSKTIAQRQTAIPCVLVPLSCFRHCHGV